MSSESGLMTPPSSHSRVVVLALTLAVASVAAVGITVTGLVLAHMFGLGSRLLIAICALAIIVGLPAVALHRLAQRSSAQN